MQVPLAQQPPTRQEHRPEKQYQVTPCKSTALKVNTDGSMASTTYSNPYARHRGKENRNTRVIHEPQPLQATGNTDNITRMGGSYTSRAPTTTAPSCFCSRLLRRPARALSLMQAAITQALGARCGCLQLEWGGDKDPDPPGQFRKLPSGLGDEAGSHEQSGSSAHAVLSQDRGAHEQV